MWGLLVVVLYVVSPTQTKVVGTSELRFMSKEACQDARSKIEKTWQINNHKINTACVFKSYL